MPQPPAFPSNQQQGALTERWEVAVDLLRLPPHRLKEGLVKMTLPWLVFVYSRVLLQAINVKALSLFIPFDSMTLFGDNLIW